MFDVDRRALVIGGGLAGMTAALSVARQGYEVYLVEREAELGGNLRHYSWEKDYGVHAAGDLQTRPRSRELLHQIIAAATSEPRIHVMTESQVTVVSGYPGHFSSTVQRNGGEAVELQHGAILVATGARQITPSEYLYGQHERVLHNESLKKT